MNPDPVEALVQGFLREDLAQVVQEVACIKLRMKQLEQLLDITDMTLKRM